MANYYSIDLDKVIDQGQTIFDASKPVIKFRIKQLFFCKFRELALSCCARGGSGVHSQVDFCGHRGRQTSMKSYVGGLLITLWN
jgi:hypothetical protein